MAQSDTKINVNAVNIAENLQFENAQAFPLYFIEYATNAMTYFLLPKLYINKQACRIYLL